MKTFFILFFSLISISIFAQTKQLELKGNRYYFEGKEYKCKELGEVYSTHPESLEIYIKARKKKKVARNMAYTGLGLIVGGVGAGLAVGDISGLVVGVLFTLGGITLELIGLAPRAIGNSQLRKARREFNYEMIRRHGYEENPSLSFGSTSNGVGLVINF